MNYLEELAYWYFRLNGFLLIADFVNHKDDDLERTHDTDILGIKLPFTKESVGGSATDYDDRFISASKKVCIIGEAKSGRFNANEILNNKKIITKDIMRLGCVSEEMAVIASEYLLHNSIWENDEYKIIKVLISLNPNESPHFINIPKEAIIDFINRRKDLYRKHEDRLFFPSQLIQYLFSD